MFSGFDPRIYDKGLNLSEALSFYISTYVERDVRQMATHPLRGAHFENMTVMPWKDFRIAPER